MSTRKISSQPPPEPDGPPKNISGRNARNFESPKEREMTVRNNLDKLKKNIEESRGIQALNSVNHAIEQRIRDEHEIRSGERDEVYAKYVQENGSVPPDDILAQATNITNNAFEKGEKFLRSAMNTVKLPNQEEVIQVVEANTSFLSGISGISSVQAKDNIPQEKQNREIEKKKP